MATQQTHDTRLLWNPENVKDVAESVGISNLSEEAHRTMTQEVEYRIGQVITEAMRFMRAAGRTTLTIMDVNAAMRALDVEPLYGYDSTRPLRYGEASLGPGQPIFYVEDEEVDFEKIINAPLPKIPRDAALTAHWLAIEGVQPSIPQNPTQSDARSNELLPKGPGANPALAALAGNDNVAHRPAVKHVLPKEMALYFDKIQTAILDDNPDEEVVRLRQAALASVRDSTDIHQLVPYFVNFISNQVTHNLHDLFPLKQVMELTAALIANKHLFLDPYASPLSASILTCLLVRPVGSEDGSSGNNNNANAAAKQEQYQLRELSASIIGELARRYSASNPLIRAKLARTCLKYFLDKDKPPVVTYGGIAGFSAVAGPEGVRVIILPTLKTVDEHMLLPLSRNPAAQLDYEMITNAVVDAVASIASILEPGVSSGEQQQRPLSDAEMRALHDFLGPRVGQRIASQGNHALMRKLLEARVVD